MKIVELLVEEFDNYEKNFSNRNFYQTTEYGSLMDRHQFDDYYLGLKDDNGNILAATLILVNKVFIGYKWGYCPRGFLIDFNNYELLRCFTNELKLYLKKRNFMFVKLDPPIIHKSRNNFGEIINGIDNEMIINNLKSLGYEHEGFNLNFETLKPRWNAVINLEETDNPFYKYSKEKRNKIRKADKLGIEIIKGSPQDISTFYDFVEKKHTRSLNYYLDMYEVFGKKDMFELYFANLNTAKFVDKSKTLYEQEESRSYNINQELQEKINITNTNNIIKRKMHSDMLKDIYQQNLIKATNLFKAYPAGKIIGATAVVKYNNEIFFLIFGYDKDFKNYCPIHYMLSTLIDYFHSQGYNRFNLNGISGDFNKNSNYYGLNRFKLGFGAHIEEYIGEFTLVINKGKTNIYNKINPVLNWLNTPVL